MMVESADNWPVGYTITCPSCYATTDVTNDNIDASAGPYVNSAGVKMYNFSCPQCGTQNGISEGATSETAAKVAPANRPAVEPAPEAPAAPVAPAPAPVAQPAPEAPAQPVEAAPVAEPAQVQAEAAPAPMTVVPAAEPFAGHPSGPHFGGALGAARESQG